MLCSVWLAFQGARGHQGTSPPVLHSVWAAFWGAGGQGTSGDVSPCAALGLGSISGSWRDRGHLPMHCTQSGQCFRDAEGTGDIFPSTALSLGDVPGSQGTSPHMLCSVWAVFWGDRGHLPPHCTQSGWHFREPGGGTGDTSPHASLSGILRNQRGGAEDIPPTCLARLQPAPKPDSPSSAHSHPCPPHSIPRGVGPPPCPQPPPAVRAGGRSHGRSRARCEESRGASLPSSGRAAGPGAASAAGTPGTILPPRLLP